MANPWDLDHMDAHLIGEVYDSLKTWVGWLEEQGIVVPACWYFYGWIVLRLLARQDWYDEVRRPSRPRRASGMVD